MTMGPPRRKPAYDPAKQWGLKPAAGAATDADGGATYVVAGHVVSGGSGAGAANMFVAETMGREGQARAARKAASKETEKTLQKIAGRDKEGMRAVVRAREVGLGADKEKKQGGGKAKGKGKPRQEGEDAREEEAEPVHRKNAFSAAVVKQLGFDPTAAKTRRVEERDVLAKVSIPSSWACPSRVC